VKDKPTRYCFSTSPNDSSPTNTPTWKLERFLILLFLISSQRFDTLKCRLAGASQVAAVGFLKLLLVVGAVFFAWRQIWGGKTSLYIPITEM
jgi:hypothetical protein